MKSIQTINYLSCELNEKHINYKKNNLGRHFLLLRSYRKSRNKSMERKAGFPMRFSWTRLSASASAIPILPRKNCLVNYIRGTIKRWDLQAKSVTSTLSNHKRWHRQAKLKALPYQIKIALEENLNGTYEYNATRNTSASLNFNL